MSNFKISKENHAKLIVLFWDRAENPRKSACSLVRYASLIFPALNELLPACHASAER